MADNEIVYSIKVDDKVILASLQKIDKEAAKPAQESGGFGQLGAAMAKLGPAAVAAGAAIATYLVGAGLNKSIEAAVEQENAINRMNQALNISGRFSAQASEDLISFSEEIQRTTTTADDAALSYISLATIYTKTNAETKKLTMASIDMAAAMGVSADTALRQLGATLSGTAGRLSKIVPELANLTEEQLKAGAAIDILSKKFSGSGEQAAKTFGGAMTQLKNSFGDVLDEIGFFFTKSDSLRKAFVFIKDAVSALAKRIGGFRNETGDIFQPILLAIGHLTRAAITVLGPVLETIINIFDEMFEGVGRVGAIIANVFTGNFAGAAELVKDQVKDSFNFSDIFNWSGTGGAQIMADSFIATIQSAKPSMEAVLPTASGFAGGGEEKKDDKKEETMRDLSMLGMLYDNLANKVKVNSAAIITNFAAVKKQMLGTFVTGISSAMSAMGAALVTGENVLAAFGKAILGTIGELALQLGQFYFLKGVLMSLEGLPGAAANIAGGLALMALGGALKAIAGGAGGASAGSSSTASAGGGSAGGTTSAVGDETTSLADTPERQRVSTITVNIEGNVLGDKRTLGLEIADALNEAFGNDGILIARGAIS